MCGTGLAAALAELIVVLSMNDIKTSVSAAVNCIHPHGCMI